MKKYFLFLIAAIGIMMASCSREDDGPVTPTPSPEISISQAMIDSIYQAIFDKNNVAKYNEISSELVSPVEMANRIYGPEGANGDEDVANARKAFMDNCNRVSDSIANKLGQNGFALNFRTHKFNYVTVDENNQPLTLSAFMCWACYRDDEEKIMDQNHIVFVCPYTHTKWNECATESDGGMERKTMACDNLFIIPDGQGFGVNRGAPQTYLAHHLHAQQYYDCLVAADRIFREKGGKFKGQWGLRVVGASQGGGDALSLHKYLETHDYEYDLTPYYNSNDENDKKIADEICKKAGVAAGTKTFKKPLKDQWRLAYSYVAVGPYNPEATLKEYLKWGKLSLPCVLPMVLKTMLAIHPELAAKYNEEDFYSDIYRKHKGEFDKVILEKTLTTSEFTDLMRKNLAYDNESKKDLEKMPLDRVLSKQMLDTNSDMCKDIMAALRQEDLTSGWTPTVKCYMYTYDGDEVVPYKNSELLEKFLGKWADVESSWFATSHEMACTFFFLKKW